VLLFALTGLTSCLWLFDTDVPQCEIDQDCRARGLSGVCVSGVCVAPAACDGGSCAQLAVKSCADENSCGAGQTCWMQQCEPAVSVERFVCPNRGPAPTTPLPLYVHTQELITGRAPIGLRVAACRIQDAACVNPLVSLSDTTGAGDVTLEVPPSFAGYLQVQSEDSLPLLHYLSQPIVAPMQLPTLVLIPKALAEMSAEAERISVDLSSTAVLIAGVRDCAGTPVEGVRFALEPAESMPFFLVNGLPSMLAKETVYDPSLQVAVGGYLAVAPGLHLLSAQLGAAGPTLGRFNVNVRAGAVVQVDFVPP
jgi:hypothetical protein